MRPALRPEGRYLVLEPLLYALSGSRSFIATSTALTNWGDCLWSLLQCGVQRNLGAG